MRVSGVAPISCVVTPVPIPNTAVKHHGAEGSKLKLVRIGKCHAKLKSN